MSLGCGIAACAKPSRHEWLYRRALPSAHYFCGWGAIVASFVFPAAWDRLVSVVRSVRGWQGEKPLDVGLFFQSINYLFLAGGARASASIFLLTPILGAAQMLTPGEPGVTPVGASSYEIKLRVPQGLAGVAPELALAYSSQGGSPTLGVGWALTGISSITRCPQTLSQDGAAWVGGITFTAADRYCLDGQRLVAVPDPGVPNSVPGIYGAAGTYYATEIDSLSKVRSLGSIGGGSVPSGGVAHSPESFVVKTKNGLTMQFGSNLNSRIYAVGVPAVSVWALTRITDTRGNYISFTYSSADSVNGQHYPVRIEYAGNDFVSPVVPPASRIDFVYDNGVRIDKAPAFSGGARVATTVRLRAVQMVSSGSLVREYRVAYGPYSALDSRTQVTSIQECAASGACLPATNFTWLADKDAWKQPLDRLTTGPAVGVPVAGQCISADFTGDGLTDVACYTGTGSWHMMLASAAVGSATWQTTFWPGGADPGTPAGAQCVTGDFNGDGKSDMACYTGRSGGVPNWHIIFSTGSGWSDGGFWVGPSPAVPVTNQCLSGDFNADAKTDLICYTGSNGSWHQALSTGAAWQLSFVTAPAPAVPVWNQCFTGEFDGDGRTDIACYTGGGGNWHVVRSTGSGFMGGIWGGGPDANHAGDRCVTGDFNGDGKTDVTCYTGLNGNWHVALSKGAGNWFSGFWSGGPNVRFPLSDQCRVGDYNADGKSDLLCHAGSGTWHLASSSGEGWVTRMWTQGPNPGSRIGDQCLTGEFNGDIKTDLVCYDGNSRTWWTALTNPTFNGLVDQVSRPMGVVASFVYSFPSTTIGNRYRQTLPVVSPKVPLVPTTPIVTRMTAPNGIGGVRHSDYWYDTAAIEPSTGRGFLGYRKTTRKDELSGVSTITTYSQDYPFSGQVLNVKTTTAAGATLTETDTSYLCRVPAWGMANICSLPAQPGMRYLVLPGVTVAKSWDLNGAPLPWSRTVNSGIDGYGNFQSVLTETLSSDGATSAFRKTASNVFFNDPVNWSVGRLLRSVVTSTDVPTVASSIAPEDYSTPSAPPPPGGGGVSPSPNHAAIAAAVRLLLQD